MLEENIKETLCINQIIGQKNITTVVEEDFVVPDIKPDILNSISNSGTVCIYKKEIMEGKIKIEGAVNSYIIYLAETEETQIRSLNVNLDFSQIIDLENLKVGMSADTNIKIKQIDCRVLNGRKINVKVFLDIEIKAYLNDNLEFLNSVKNIEDVQLLKESMKVNSLLGKGTTKVYAKDTMMLDDIDELAEIMKVNVDIKNKESKISYNKVLIKADACVKIMYLTTDNRICVKKVSVPVMGFIDMPDVSDDNICQMQYEIKNILVKPQVSDDNSIYVEIEIEIDCSTYTTKELELIQDLYSPSVNLEYKQNSIKTMTEKCCNKDICAIREKQLLEEFHSNTICDVDVNPYILNHKIMDNRIIFEGETEIKLILLSDDKSELDCKTFIIPFNFNMEALGIDENTKINYSIEVKNDDFVIMPDQTLDIKIDLEFTVDSYKNKNINLIDEVQIVENRDSQRYSVIIYLTKPGDTLWKIAKRFRSRVDAIAAINGIENENNIEVGQQLFIPMTI